MHPRSKTPARHAILHQEQPQILHRNYDILQQNLSQPQCRCYRPRPRRHQQFETLPGVLVSQPNRANGQAKLSIVRRNTRNAYQLRPTHRRRNLRRVAIKSIPIQILCRHLPLQACLPSTIFAEQIKCTVSGGHVPRYRRSLRILIGIS